MLQPAPHAHTEHSLAEAIVKCLDVDLELLFNYTLGRWGIVFSVVPRPRIRASMRKHFTYPKLFCDHGPVFLQALESANEVCQHLAIGVDKPIKLVTMRRGMNAGAATILNPMDELLECHLLAHLHWFIALIERDHTVPRIANKSELKVAFELSPSPFFPTLRRQRKIEPFQYSIFSSPAQNPVAFHQPPHLTQVQVRLNRLSQQVTHAGRTGLGNFHEDALVA